MVGLLKFYVLNKNVSERYFVMNYDTKRAPGQNGQGPVDTAHLPGDHGVGEVPGCDHADHSDGLAYKDHLLGRGRTLGHLHKTSTPAGAAPR